MKYWIFVACPLWIFAVIVGYNAGRAVDLSDREYTVLVTSSAPPAQIIGRIQVGLNKAEAEGTAFQLNEMFAAQKVGWSAVALVQSEIKPK